MNVDCLTQIFSIDADPPLRANAGKSSDNLQIDDDSPSSLHNFRKYFPHSDQFTKFSMTFTYNTIKAQSQDQVPAE